MIHQLKIKPEYFQAIAEGRKNFEVRNNDRQFQAGDFLALNELATVEQFGETGRCLLVEVTYILNNQDYCKDGQVIIGIRPCAITRIGARTPENECCPRGGVPVYDARTEDGE